MGRNVTGTFSILKLAKLICKLVGRFGTGHLAIEASPEFALAVGALVTACHALEAIDDQPYIYDHEAPVAGGDVALA